MDEVRAAILKKLYDIARENPHIIVSLEDLKEEFNLNENELIFHLKYLDEMGFIEFQEYIGGGGHVKITALGINAVENPGMFVKDAPFLQQIVIHGNVINSTILQAESIKIRNGLNRIIQQITDPEIANLIQELIAESYKEEPDASKIKSVWKTVKEKAPDIAAKITPYVMKLLEKWLDS